MAKLPEFIHPKRDKISARSNYNMKQYTLDWCHALVATIETKLKELQAVLLKV
jgi:hypothetical protein